MKTVSTLIMKTRLITASVVLGAVTMFQPVGALAQKAEKAVQKVSSSAPALMGRFYEVEPFKVRLHLANPGATTVDIAIRDEKNQVVYKESFKSTSFSRILDLNTLAEGQYRIEVGNRLEGISRSFSVTSRSNDTVVAQALERQQGSDMLATIYEMAPKMVKVHVANPSGQKVSMKVRNQKNEMVLQKTMSGKQLAQILDLTRLADGAYTIQVASQDGRVSRTYTIDSGSSRTFAWIGNENAISFSSSK